jgi:hypothetical protein
MDYGATQRRLELAIANSRTLIRQTEAAIIESRPLCRAAWPAVSYASPIGARVAHRAAAA